MRDFIAKISLTALFALAIFSASAAEKVTFEASSPLTVAVGEAFRVEFALNAYPDKGTFKAPSFEGFDVIAGPAESSGQSIQIVNGAMTKSINYTITYVLLPQAAGNVTVGAAEVTVDGTVYRSNALPIEIVNEGKSPGAGGTQSRPREDSSPDVTAQNQIAKDDILLRAVVSRTSVYKGEPLRVTFKLYERVPVVGYNDVKFPSFNGFWAQELNTDNARRQRETFNGKVYETLVAKEYLLYPQQAGTLVIEPAELTAVAQVVVPGRRNVDPFFGGGPDFVNVPRKVQSPRINIAVKPLPAGAPASFSGAVGSFTMDAVLPQERLAANSAATYTVKISGTGNLTFVQAPKLTLPASFEQYNVKTTESINTSAAGISGYRQFEYPFIARAEGTYEVEPVEFSYFDPSRMQYMTLKSKALELEITPDAKGGGDAPVVQGRGMSKEEVKLLGQDIRFIKLGSPQLRSVREPFLFSAAYWVLFFGILILFAMVYVALRRQIRESQNVALLRGKRANKVAVQRFRAAKRYMEEQNRHAFYEEMLRALWGYMSDKFNIPVANLTKENVREELHKRGVLSEESQRFTAIITKCDEAQYSPAASARMTEVYGEGVDIISRIEAMIKR
ncbi:BatD family protein [Alistipes finegoldii]|uniref:BatD family protein n=1 Tax=Alistipes finegoldii TaxID=214856 RepID=UPI002A831311|nr:BatD family protein [Alistipes finegoldii]MDY4091286.1 BatD family protein [Alistipes finegoldii]